MKQVFFSKLVRKSRAPAGVLTVTDDLVRLDYDDLALGQILTELYRVPLCRTITRGGKVFKYVCGKDRLPAVLKRVKKPYYFSDPIDRAWKHSKIVEYLR